MLSRILLILAAFATVPNAVAQNTDGEWNGRLECSAVFPGIRSLTPEAYGQSVRFQSNGGMLSGSIDDAVTEQKLTGSIAGNRLMLVMDAKQKGRPVWWQTVLDGPVTQGVASLSGFLLAADGRTQVRRCSMTVSSAVYAAQRRETEAAQKAAAAKAADGKAAAERAAQDRAVADAVARQRAEADRVSSERATEERLAAERLATERRIAERAAAAARVKTASAAPSHPQRADNRTEPVSTDKVAAEKLAADKAAAEKAAAEKVSAERRAAEKLASEREAAEKAAAERALAEKAAADRAQRLAAEKAATEKKSPIRARSSMDL